MKNAHGRCIQKDMAKANERQSTLIAINNEANTVD